MTQDNGIDQRTFRFACDVVDYVRTIKREPGIGRIVDQLVDSAGAIGANREEAHAGTPREFVHSNRIALKEARESHFWLRVCANARIGDLKRCRQLVGEADQIKRILGAIVVRAKMNLEKNEQRERDRFKLASEAAINDA